MEPRDCPPQVLHYYGRPVTGLSRDELIQALYDAVAQVDDERRFHMQTLDIFCPRSVPRVISG